MIGNSVTFIGRMVRDPELKNAGTVSVTNFTLARNRRVKGEDKTSFIDFTAFDKTAEVICQYVKKGHRIAVQGNIDTRQWEDKDGNKRTATFCVVEGIELLEKRDDSAPVEKSQPTRNAPDETEADDDSEDLPF